MRQAWVMLDIHAILDGHWARVLEDGLRLTAGTNTKID